MQNPCRTLAEPPAELIICRTLAEPCAEPLQNPCRTPAEPLQNTPPPFKSVCNGFQLHLDIQTQYDLTAPSWEGEYVTPQADAPIPAFGQADQAVSAYVNRNALYVRLQAKHT